MPTPTQLHVTVAARLPRNTCSIRLHILTGGKGKRLVRVFIQSELAEHLQ